MARYVADQNQVAFIYESGTYANTSGTAQWIGLVQEHNPNTNKNIQTISHVSSDTRSADKHVEGGVDYDGTLTYFPQDWKMLGFALGSIVDGGSPSPYTHELKEANSADGNPFTSGTLNPFVSFTIEDAHKGTTANNNSVKTINGCMVDSFDFSWSEKDITEVSVGYIAQNITPSSGAASTLTNVTTRPFIGQDVLVHVPSGTVIRTVKAGNFSISNNIERAHYNNGSVVSDVPYPTQRQYAVGLTLDETSEDVHMFDTDLYRNGSVFNMMIEVRDASAGAGSRDAFIFFSGCKITQIQAPTAAEGINTNEITIVPKNCSAIVNDLIQKYSPW